VPAGLAAGMVKPDAAPGIQRDVEAVAVTPEPTPAPVMQFVAAQCDPEVGKIDGLYQRVDAIPAGRGHRYAYC